MKKIYLLFCLAFLTLAANAQSFSGPTTVQSGQEFTLTGVGENAVQDRSVNFYYFVKILGINNSDTQYPTFPSNPAQYINVALTSSTTFNTINKTPTSVKVIAKNTYSSPIQVTFYVSVQEVIGKTSGSLEQTGAINIPYTVTIQPDPNIPHQGTYARLVATKLPTYGGDPESPAVEVSVYFFKYSNATGPLTVTNLTVNWKIAGSRGVPTLTSIANGDHVVLAVVRNLNKDRDGFDDPNNITADRSIFRLLPGDYTIYLH